MPRLNLPLSKFSSASQIDSIFNDSKITRWTDDDMSKAITLRSLSPKAYRYIKEVCSFPYPSVSTLQRWASKLYVEPGILPTVLNLLNLQAKGMTKQERLCVMSIDEYSVAHEWTYDKGTDSLLQPVNRAHCIMISGLIKPWKQLVFYDFYCKISKELV